ncbi:MAG: hypothetical protein ABFE02_00370 [Sulfuricella sp.]
MRHALVSALALIGVHEHLSAEQKNDLVQAGLQSTPGATAAAGARFFGWQASDILTVLSILFILAQFAHLAWKWRRDARREGERIEDRKRGVVPGCDFETSDD